MADTKLKGKLPDGDANGLKGDAWRKRLVAEPLKPHVAIVVFNAPHSSKDYEKAIETPIASLMAFEPIEGPAADVLLEQLKTAAMARTAQTPLDFPDEPEGSGQGPREPLALEAEVGYQFQIRDGVAGRFTLVLLSKGGAELGKRGNLIRKEHGGPSEGVYSIEVLPESLQELARVLIDEHEDVVDAEIVDDEPEEL